MHTAAPQNLRCSRSEGLLWENEASQRLHEESTLAYAQQLQTETLQRKPWRPHKSHARKNVIPRSERSPRKWCETINTQTLQSQHGHRKYRGCHWDRTKYNWALRVHKVWVKWTAYRHFLDVGHPYLVVFEHAWKWTQLVSWDKWEPPKTL